MVWIPLITLTPPRTRDSEREGYSWGVWGFLEAHLWEPLGKQDPTSDESQYQCGPRPTSEVEIGYTSEDEEGLERRLKVQVGIETVGDPSTPTQG